MCGGWRGSRDRSSYKAGKQARLTGVIITVVMMLQISEDANKLGMLFIFILHWLISGIYATHFRGGIIMVRPVDGDTPAEVMHALLLYYNPQHPREDTSEDTCTWLAASTSKDQCRPRNLLYV